MPITITPEDGTGLANANSYASVAEGDTYHATHLYATDWTAATDERKKAALIMATRSLNNAIEWKGSRKGIEQALEWPRILVPRPELEYVTQISNRLLQGAYWPDDQVPAKVKEATMEMARILLGEDRTADDETRGISRLGLGQGAVDISFDTTSSTRKYVLTDEVIRMLSPFGCPRGKRSSVSVVRVQ